MRHTETKLSGDIQVHSFVAHQTSHLIVRGDHSVLIDCHDATLASEIARRSLPLPRQILHTHVQPEHCREADAFGGAVIAVSEADEELASDALAYQRKTKTVWDRPWEWETTFGREPYGIAGAVTSRPPRIPLRIEQCFRAGDIVGDNAISLRVIDLAAHGRHAVGFILDIDGTPTALFSGDLLCDRAKLVNIYDLEVNYVSTALPTVRDLLLTIANMGVEIVFPSTGPPLLDGCVQARELATNIDAYLTALRWSPVPPRPEMVRDYPRLGRYLKLADGVYQIDNFGNCILFIDSSGRGLMIDPGPCDFQNADRVQDFIADLELFERHAGLRVIERILITHMHGDHLDMAPIVKERYSTCRLAAWDLVARVIAAPREYPYAALLPWYNVGHDRTPVDDVLLSGESYFWNDIAIVSDHLPGHCEAHAAYFFEFNGVRIAITGDTIQSRGPSESIFYTPCNDCVPNENSGCIKAIRTLLRHNVDLNIGGHGSHFNRCREMYKQSLDRMMYALPFLKRLVPEGDMVRAFRRSWYPELTPSRPA